MRQVLPRIGVEILNILAQSNAADRLSLCRSGSPASLASHFDRSSCTCLGQDAIDSEAGELAPEMVRLPRPSRVSWYSVVSCASRVLASPKMRLNVRLCLRITFHLRRAQRSALS